MGEKVKLFEEDEEAPVEPVLQVNEDFKRRFEVSRLLIRTFDVFEHG